MLSHTMDKMTSATEGLSNPHSTPVRVETFDDPRPDRWDAFLDEHPGGSFYHLHGWQSINQSHFGHETFYLIAKRGELTQGVLPLVLLRSRLFGRILCSLPFVNYGGAVAVDAETERCLIKEAIAISQRVRADYLEVRSPHTLAMDLPVARHKVSMTLHLDADPETVWKGFASKHRTNIRRVYKHGVVVQAGGAELLGEFYQVISEAWRSMGTPIYHRRYFQEIISHYPNRTRIFVCRQENRPIAVAFNGEFNKVVEGLWLGSRPEARHLQASYVLYWEMIKDACERGLSRFHLGRSTTESGGESFKRKWNAESRPLHWYYYMPQGGHIPQLNVNNPKYRLAISTWRRLPLWVTTLIGPWIARSIP